jgi:hypothetical protein
MKLVSILCVCAAALILGGCVVAERDIGEVGDQVQEGLSGRGRIIERDPTSDSFGGEYQ